MKNLFSIVALVFVCSLFMTSCKDKCKSCSATIVQSLDGVEVSTSTVSAIEYCEEQLEALESNLVQTITQTVGGYSQTIVTTYTCN